MLKKNEVIAVGAAIAAIGMFLFGGQVMGLFSPRSVTNTSSAVQSTNNTMNPTTEFKIEELALGNGAEAKAGDLVTLHYVGTLSNGMKFDSSIDRGQPFQFIVGVGQVIPGFDRGLLGMKVGGKRRITIPSDLGYGANQAGPIPPNSTLIFEVELLKTENSGTN